MSFKAVQGKIEKEGYSKEQAGAILASKTRAASPAAKRANPKLRKVKMPKHLHSSKADSEEEKKHFKGESVAEERSESPKFEKTEDETEEDHAARQVVRKFFKKHKD